MERMISLKKGEKIYSKIMHNGKCVYNLLDSLRRWEPGLSDFLVRYPELESIVVKYPSITQVVTDYNDIAILLAEYPDFVNSLINTGKENYTKCENSAYIKTSFSANENYIIKVDFKIIDDNVFNVLGSDTSYAPSLTNNIARTFDGKSLFRYSCFGKVSATFSNYELIINNNSIEKTSNNTAIGGKLCIFGRYLNYTGTGMIKKIEIIKNDNLISLLYPFVKDKVVGMIDIAPIYNRTGDAVFYGNNSSSGSFSIVTI